jgi:hypothetical protein
VAEEDIYQCEVSKLCKILEIIKGADRKELLVGGQGQERHWAISRICDAAFGDLRALDALVK